MLLESEKLSSCRKSCYYVNLTLLFAVFWENEKVLLIIYGVFLLEYKPL